MRRAKKNTPPDYSDALKGRTALVTGGGRGIGRAIAVALAAAGCKVAVCARTRAEIEDTASVIADMGGQAMSVRADVSDAGDVKNLIRQVKARLGPVEILVNNAGVIGPVADICDVPEADFDSCLGINVKGVYLVSKEVVPGMKSLKRGKIINVTSGLAEAVMPRVGAYSITKAAVSHMTRIMAEELGPYNIQVNGLDPGTVDTRMHEELRAMDIGVLGPEMYSLVWGLKKGGMLKDPAEAARLAVFLASDKTDLITGEVGTAEHFAALGFKKAA